MAARWRLRRARRSGPRRAAPSNTVGEQVSKQNPGIGGKQPGGGAAPAPMGGRRASTDPHDSTGVQDGGLWAARTWRHYGGTVAQLAVVVPCRFRTVSFPSRKHGKTAKQCKTSKEMRGRAMRLSWLISATTLPILVEQSFFLLTLHDNAGDRTRPTAPGFECTERRGRILPATFDHRGGLHGSWTWRDSLPADQSPLHGVCRHTASPSKDKGATLPSEPTRAGARADPTWESISSTAGASRSRRGSAQFPRAAAAAAHPPQQGEGAPAAGDAGHAAFSAS